MIIGISGHIGSGKDTAATIIKGISAAKSNERILECLQNEAFHTFLGPFVVKKFAGKLKQIASILTGVDVWKFEDQEFKKQHMSPEYGMTYREFLQKLGTEAMRNGLHENIWPLALFADFNEDSNWLITDVRFPNEATAIKERGGILIRIEREGDETHGQHPSETALDDYKEWDFVIDNNGTLEELIEKIREVYGNV